MKEASLLIETYCFALTGICVPKDMFCVIMPKHLISNAKTIERWVFPSRQIRVCKKNYFPLMLMYHSAQKSPWDIPISKSEILQHQTDSGLRTWGTGLLLTWGHESDWSSYVTWVSRVQLRRMYKRHLRATILLLFPYYAVRMPQQVIMRMP